MNRRLNDVHSNHVFDSILEQTHVNMNYQARIDALNRAAGLEDGSVDAIMIVPGSNLVYFTGLHIHLSERPAIAVFTRDGLSMIIPQLEMQQLNIRPDLEARPFAWSDVEGYEGAFAELIDTLGLRGKKIGIDGMTMRVTEWLAFTKIDPTLQVVPIERALIGVRAHKMPDEVAAMRRAIAISEAALDKLLQEVQPGMTEAQIAARLEALQMALGADELAFSAHVQIGENSSNPHGVSGDRKLREGEFLLIDYGCRVNGYPSDITRTFCLGTPTAEMQRIYDTVLRANEAAKAVVAPGIPMRVVDKAARDIIEAAGYGEYFTHRTGHGLGLDVHEPIPQIASNIDDPLEPGMTFTIEPGIYIPSLGGVRIEDNVLVTDTGMDVLTSFRRELRAR